MKDIAEIARLRTLLKNVNVEHSALLRGTGQEAKLVRLEALKRRRLTLMFRIAELRQGAEALPATWQAVADAPQPETGSLSASVLAARAMTATVQRYWAGWLGGSQARSGATAVPSE